MILGFFGKGGSGKSTVATQTTFLLQQNKKNTVLAIDADHNMDLSFNITGGAIPNSIKQLSEGAGDVKEFAGASQSQSFADVFSQKTDARFSICPQDAFTKKYAYQISDNLHLMVAGFKTEKVLHEKACAHSLSAPLKVYLPLLQLSEHDFVIVDEKAGADGVTTGIVSGIDVAVIVCEPALHSTKTARQIAELMDFYKTPYMFVGNKVANEEDRAFIAKSLEAEPVGYLHERTNIKQDPSTFLDDWQQSLEKIYAHAKKIHTNTRLERTYEKYKISSTL